jgi:hypothetical protein
MDTILGILWVKSYYDIRALADLFCMHPQVSTIAHVHDNMLLVFLSVSRKVRKRTELWS